MKRAFKYFAAMLAAAILCLTLVACGEKGTKYIFKEARDEGTLLGAGAPVDMMTEAYQGSYIIVGNGEIEWRLMDAASTIGYTMDGDKYILKGELFESMEQQYPGSIGETWYGQKTEEGFEIIYETSASENASEGIVRVVFSFTAA